MRVKPEHRRQLAEVIEKNAGELETAVRRDLSKRTGKTLSSVKNQEIPGTHGMARKLSVGERGGDGWYVRFDEFGTLGRPGNAAFFGNYRRLKPKFKTRMKRAHRKAHKQAMK